MLYRRSLVTLLLLFPVTAQSFASLSNANPTSASPTIAYPSKAPNVHPAASPFHSAGLHELNGELWGGGPDYKARFDATSWEYTPALGEKAPRNFPVRFQLAGLSRGSFVPAGAVAAPHWAGLRVTYARPGVVERCDMRTDGVELSYLLETLPAGSGDLTLSIEVTSELWAEAHGDGLRLSAGDFGGVSIGAVTGIDADGKRANGKVAMRGTTLELSLPAAFVDAAKLPLVVDPLVGTNLLVADSTATYSNASPDTAYDQTEDVYLVVWHRLFSSGDVDIRGQRVNRDGTLRGGLLQLTTGSNLERNPRVANINLRDAFVVTHEWDYDVYAQGVLAANGAISSPIAVATGIQIQTEADVGGEATIDDDEAVVVWYSDGFIGSQQVNLDASGTPSLVGSSVSLFDYNAIHDHVSPSISNTGGLSGHYLVVAERRFASGTATSTFGTVITRNLVVLQPPFLAAVVSGKPFQTFPAVDGDGTNWVVAFEAFSATSTNDRDIYAASWSYLSASGLQLNAGAQPVEAEANDDERFPAVAWTGTGACLVGWIDQQGSPSITVPVVKSVDLFTCAICEPQAQLTANDDDYGEIAICSTLPLAQGAAEEGLIVFRALAGGNPTILARRWDSEDGFYASLGGGCGPSGEAYATCSRVGHAEFRLRVRDATFTGQPVLIISQDTLHLGCGLCELRANPYTGFVMTPASASIGIAIPIPNLAELRGTTWFTQWVLPVTTSPQCSALGANLSDALVITIE